MLRGVLLGEDWLCVIRNLEYFKEVSIDYVGIFNMICKKYCFIRSIGYRIG